MTGKGEEAPRDFSPSSPNTNTSGTVIVSGTTSGFEGPHFVETQSLTITYNRVPFGRLVSGDVTLSSASATFSHYSTIVVATVEAAYVARKDFGTYETSTFSTPQKFEVLAASSDVNGNSYGETTASTMGPMGTIVTSQQFYRRVPFVGAASGQAEVTKNIVGRTFYGIRKVGGSTSATVDVNSLFYDNEAFFITPGLRGSFGTEFGPRPVIEGVSYLYGIPGQYATNKESIFAVTNFITQIGNRVRSSDLYENPATENPGGFPFGLADVGFSEYDPARHDYS